MPGCLLRSLDLIRVQRRKLAENASVGSEYTKYARKEQEHRATERSSTFENMSKLVVLKPQNFLSLC